MAPLCSCDKCGHRYRSMDASIFTSHKGFYNPPRRREESECGKRVAKPRVVPPVSKPVTQRTMRRTPRRKDVAVCPRYEEVLNKLVRDTEWRVIAD